MIDIRETARAIADLKIADPASRLAAIHQQVRIYGVELLMCLANAIQPTNEQEALAVNWLKQEVAKIANQIPLPVAAKPSKEKAS